MTVEDKIIEMLGLSEEEAGSQDNIHLWMFLQDRANEAGIEYVRCLDNGKYEFWYRKDLEELDEKEREFLNQFLDQMKANYRSLTEMAKEKGFVH